MLKMASLREDKLTKKLERDRMRQDKVAKKRAKERVRLT